MRVETDRLILRNWQLTDAEDLVKLLNNFEIAKNLTIPFPYTLDDAISWIKKNMQKSKRNYYYFAVIRKSDNALIGGTSLALQDEKEMDNGGIWLDASCHGQGLGTEVWTAMSRLWFADKNNNVIYSGYFSYNKASEKLHKKVGYKEFGVRKQLCPALGKEVDEILVKLTRNDFEKYYRTLDFEFKVREDNAQTNEM